MSFDGFFILLVYWMGGSFGWCLCVIGFGSEESYIIGMLNMFMFFLLEVLLGEIVFFGLMVVFFVYFFFDV